jgi:hypothetical protein
VRSIKPFGRYTHESIFETADCSFFRSIYVADVTGDVLNAFAVSESKRSKSTKNLEKAEKYGRLFIPRAEISK